MAAEAGRATRWLIARNIDGCAVLASLLNVLDPTNPEHQSQSPIMRGLSLADAPSILQGGAQSWPGIIEPLMILPFAGYAARQLERVLRISGEFGYAHTDGQLLAIDIREDWANASKVAISDTEIRLAPESVKFRGPALAVQLSSRPTSGPELGQARCQPFEPSLTAAVTAAQFCTRSTPDSVAWSMLNAYALRTYAPATEQSRLRGAGAGLSDND